jgi:membrane protein DedA with SNARE-associated domain
MDWFHIAQSFVVQHGYWGLFFLLVLGIIGIPFPDEWVLIFAGYLILKGDFQLFPAFASAFMGSLCGITLSYIIGRTGGLRVLEKFGPRVHVRAGDIVRIQAWYGTYGKWTLIFGYFIPGVRHLTAFMAGACRLRLLTFGGFAYPGALIWSTSFLAAGYLLGEGWANSSGRVHKISVILGVVLTAVLLFMLRRRHKREDAPPRIQ